MAEGPLARGGAGHRPRRSRHGACVAARAPSLFDPRLRRDPRRGCGLPKQARGTRHRETRGITQMAITLTESAARHVAAHLQKRGKGVGLRLGVRRSGCSGFAYDVEYADEVRPDDAEFESHGVRILVDLKS